MGRGREAATADRRRLTSGGALLSLVCCLAATLSPAAEAHPLSLATARAEAEAVAEFVAGVVATEYDLRRYGVSWCERRGEHKALCVARWDVTEREAARKRWTCRADIIVWLEDHETDALDWDYRRVRCKPVR